MTKKTKKDSKPKKKKARFVSFTKPASPVKTKAVEAADKKHRSRLTKFLADAKVALSDDAHERMARVAGELSKGDNALYHRLFTAMHNRPWTDPD